MQRQDAPSDARTPVPPGTLVMLILKTLSHGPLHGYAIAQEIRRASREVLQIEEGSLYPALQRMLLKGSPLSKVTAPEAARESRWMDLFPFGDECCCAAFRRFISD